MAFLGDKSSWHGPVFQTEGKTGEREVIADSGDIYSYLHMHIYVHVIAFDTYIHFQLVVFTAFVPYTARYY